jgi:anti-anti-sigma factor
MFTEPVREPVLSVDVGGDDELLERRVTVAGEMDMLSATVLQDAVADVLGRRPRRIELDLHDVTFLDSAGIRTLLTCHAEAGRAGCELNLVDPHPRVYRVLEITGLLGHFQLVTAPVTDRSANPR